MTKIELLLNLPQMFVGTLSCEVLWYNLLRAQDAQRGVRKGTQKHPVAVRRDTQGYAGIRRDTQGYAGIRRGTQEHAGARST